MTNDKRRGKPNPQPWTPPKDGVLGGVDPQAKELVFSSQQRVQQIQVQIGALEMQKDRLMGQARQINAEAQQVIDKEAERLGIPPGVPWQMGADGVARLAQPPGVPQQGPPPAPPGVPPGTPPTPPTSPGRPVMNLAEHRQEEPEEEPPAEEPPADEPAEEEPTTPEGEENG